MVNGCGHFHDYGLLFGLPGKRFICRIGIFFQNGEIGPGQTRSEMGKKQEFSCQNQCSTKKEEFQICGHSRIYHLIIERKIHDCIAAKSQKIKVEETQIQHEQIQLVAVGQTL